MFNIDLGRGVTYRKHSAGMSVFMYKDEPGVYRSASGEIVSDEIAAQVGFPVAELSLLKERADKVKEAIEAIDLEYGANVEEVIYVRSGFSAVCDGPGRFSVHDETGTKLTDRALSRDEAIMLVDQLAPSAEPEVLDLDVGADLPEPETELDPTADGGVHSDV